MKRFTKYIQTFKTCDVKSSEDMETIYNYLLPYIKKTETTHLLHEAQLKTQSEKGNWHKFVSNFLDRIYAGDYYKHVRDTIGLMERKRNEKCSSFMARIIAESAKIPTTNASHMRDVDLKDLLINKVQEQELVKYLILKGVTDHKKTMEDMTRLIRNYEKASAFAGVSQRQVRDVPRDAPRNPPRDAPPRETHRDTPRDLPRDTHRDTYRDSSQKQYRATEDKQQYHAAEEKQHDRQPSGGGGGNRNNRNSGERTFNCTHCQLPIKNKEEHQKQCQYFGTKNMKCSFCNKEVLKKDEHHMLNCPQRFCRPCRKTGRPDNHSWHQCEFTQCRSCKKDGHSQHVCSDKKNRQNTSERDRHFSDSVRSQPRAGAPFCDDCQMNYEGDANTHSETCHSLNHEEYTFGYDSGETEIVTRGHASNVGCGKCARGTYNRTIAGMEVIRAAQMEDDALKGFLQEADETFTKDPEVLRYYDRINQWAVLRTEPRVVSIRVPNDFYEISIVCSKKMATLIVQNFFYSPLCREHLIHSDENARWNPDCILYNLEDVFAIEKDYTWASFKEDMETALRIYDEKYSLSTSNVTLEEDFMGRLIRLVRPKIDGSLNVVEEEINDKYAQDDAHDALVHLKWQANHILNRGNLTEAQVYECSIMGEREFLIELMKLKIAELVGTLLRGIKK